MPFSNFVPVDRERARERERGRERERERARVAACPRLTNNPRGTPYFLLQTTHAHLNCPCYCETYSCVPTWESRDSGLTGRVLYIDLDTVISGPLDDIAAFSGPFAALSVAGMINERRSTGTNSSVMCWDAVGAGGALRLNAIYDLLEDAYAIVSGPNISAQTINR